MHPVYRVALSASYINGVVAFVGDLFPAGRAGVSIFEGISEALAAEDVATLCRDNETSILHNLEDTTRIRFVAALVSGSSSQSHPRPREVTQRTRGKGPGCPGAVARKTHT